LNTKDFEFNDNPENYLLYFGRIHHDKGCAEAIDIAKKSKRKLLIAGIIQDEDYFKDKIEPKLNDQIQYIGHAGPEKRNALLGRAAALLHPINFNEPFGMSVAEAMLCGTPVIAFNKGSMPELIQHEKTGFLVNTIDEAVEVVNQVKNINREDCCNWAKSQFSREKMVDDYLKLYQQILG